jgi:hypothetical protein
MSPPASQFIPKQLSQALVRYDREFPNEDACFTRLAEVRIPDGLLKCDECGVVRKHHRVRRRRAYACDYCGNHIYPLSGTILQRTFVSIRKWFYVMYRIKSTRRRFSARQLSREIDVSHATAGRMVRQVRSLNAGQLVVARNDPIDYFLEVLLGQKQPTRAPNIHLADRVSECGRVAKAGR